MKETLSSALFKFRACPYCGFRLAVATDDEVIACPNCGEESDVNNLLPLSVEDAKIKPINEEIPSYSGSLEPLSVQKFIEEYYARIDIGQAGVEIDLKPVRFLPLINSLELTKGDDKATWQAKFTAYYRPYERKLFCIEEAEAKALELYNANNLHILNVLFEQIRESISEVLNLKDAFFDRLEECLRKTAECEGVLPSEIELMSGLISGLRAQVESKRVPENIYEIEDIALAKTALDTAIATDLSGAGINANANYNEGKSLLAAGNEAEAIAKLKPLGQYKDAAMLVEEAKRWAQFNGELLYLGGLPYLIFAHAEVEKEIREDPVTVDLFDFFRPSLPGLDLYPVKDEEPDLKNPVILNFQFFLACFGDYFYYINELGKISCINCQTREQKTIETLGFKPRPDLFYQTVNEGEEGILLVESAERNAVDPNRNFFRLLIIKFGDFTNPIHVFSNPIDNLRNLNDHLGPCRYPYVCAARAELIEAGSTIIEKTHIDIIDLKHRETKTDFLIQNGEFVDGDEEFIYYAAYKNSKYNVDVYQKSFATGAERLLVSNVFHAVTVIDKRLYYTVGNRHKQTLYCLDVLTGASSLVMDRFDGYGMGSLLSDNFYFYRGSGYNRTLMRTGGINGAAVPVACHVSPKEGAFAEFKGGHFYYVDAFEKLCRVCLDGEHFEVVARNVDRILKVDVNYIYYLLKETVDELYDLEEERAGKKYRISNSVYRYSILDNKAEKILFNVENAAFFDSERLFAYSADIVTFRTTNLAPKKNFDVKCLIREYSFYNVKTGEKKVLATFGKPHGKKRGKVLEFALATPIRPYIDDRDLVKIYYKGKKGR